MKGAPCSSSSITVLVLPEAAACRSLSASSVSRLVIMARLTELGDFN